MLPNILTVVVRFFQDGQPLYSVSIVVVVAAKKQPPPANTAAADRLVTPTRVAMMTVVLFVDWRISDQFNEWS